MLVCVQYSPAFCPCGVSKLQYVKVLMGPHHSHRRIQRPAFVAAVCVFTVPAFVHLPPAIKSIGGVVTGDSVEDDGRTGTSSAPASVSAAAVEQGIPACSSVHPQPRTTAAAQNPAPG